MRSVSVDFPGSFRSCRPSKLALRRAKNWKASSMKPPPVISVSFELGWADYGRRQNRMLSPLLVVAKNRYSVGTSVTPVL